MKTFTLENTTLFDAVYNYLEKSYDYKEITRERIDEFYNTVEVGCCKFNPSRVLEELDPIGFDMWVDEEISEDAQNIIDGLEENNNASFNGCNIKLVDNVLEIESVVKC
ncbi:MAG TPA: hypothetical protein DDW20_02315 [Firmicutes bacterium]|nr:hypothetical protein [Bacillota bacterium]